MAAAAAVEEPTQVPEEPTRPARPQITAAQGHSGEIGRTQEWGVGGVLSHWAEGTIKNFERLTERR